MIAYNNNVIKILPKKAKWKSNLNKLTKEAKKPLDKRYTVFEICLVPP